MSHPLGGLVSALSKRAIRQSRRVERPNPLHIGNVGLSLGGGGEIRTLEELAPLTVFETAPFDRSGTPPWTA
jgi:hypothetical protein